MRALFCWIYPDHYWFPITRRTALRVNGLPAVLARHGYRTAYMHSGTLEYDSDGEFLKRQGFKEVIGESQDYDSPMDKRLLPKAIDWIKQYFSRPFFSRCGPWTPIIRRRPPVRDYHVADPI